jgi:hypothetical protein
LRYPSSIRALNAVLAILLFPSIAAAVTTPATQSDSQVSTIVIGFVGGFVNADNQHHGPVQLAQRVRKTAPQGTYIRIFENRRRRQARNTILHLLDTNHDRILSAEEKSHARIILFGHSWGASATVALARELQQQGIPVLLTVQVDSVAKPWQNDSNIPANVAEAVNFYQTEGIIHGRRQITAADPSKTQILGNYLLDYKKIRVECPEASWWDRVFTPGHMQSECDPYLWSSVENLVTQRIPPPVTAAENSPLDHAPSTK